MRAFVYSCATASGRPPAHFAISFYFTLVPHAASVPFNPSPSSRLVCAVSVTFTCSLALLPRRCKSLVPHPSLSDLAPQSWILLCNPYQADSAAMGQLNGTCGLHIYPLNAHAVRLGAGDELVVRVRAMLPWCVLSAFNSPSPSISAVLSPSLCSRLSHIDTRSLPSAHPSDIPRNLASHRLFHAACPFLARGVFVSNPRTYRFDAGTVDVSSSVLTRHQRGGSAPVRSPPVSWVGDA
ncbi:hypothetical protein C8J57DRAFT_385227 [Mycena rebaudengoi]|nr:hypothetical protein C8J57DRAFT_385227 [Mycena rebaudengoi]